MRHLYLLASLLLLSCANAQESNPYCNSDYNFCLDYPTEELQLESGQSNSAFAVFVSADRDIRMEVTSHKNTKAWSLEDIYYMNFEDKLRLTPDLEIVNETFEKTAFELLYQEDDRLHYHHVYKHKDIYVQLSLYLPKAQKQRFEQLKDKLDLSFNP